MTGLPLLDDHYQLLSKTSAISDEVIRRRGYRSVTEPKELNGIFSQAQRRVPALLIPNWNVYGERSGWELRPDNPRTTTDRNGKEKLHKYERPAGCRNMIDCPPSTLEHIRNEKVRLWITESTRKADALASVGLRAIAISGVWGWRGAADGEATATLPDWQGVALKRREVVICFDSDAFWNPNVHAATEQFGRWLESRGATLAFVYLPNDANGGKQGVDDYLATGHTRDDLMRRVERKWYPLAHDAREPKQRDTPSDAPLTPTGILIADVAKVIDTYMILPSRAATMAVALWVLHTYAFEAAHCTPYLAVQSPVKRSGKSRFEEVLELLVRRPWRVAAASESAMFRKISAERPTLLMDEVDALFGANAQATEPMRAILNAGNRPGAAVARVVGEGKDLKVIDFSCYCPKVLAGIQTTRWPDTVTDRSIIIRLQRKKREQGVGKLRYRKLQAETENLRARLVRWAQEHIPTLLEADPELPHQLNDRAAEAWEPLLAIAELADHESDGEERWAQRARQAAVTLGGAVGADEGEYGVLALVAIRTMIGTAEAIHTSTIVEKLNAAEELPFGEYRKGAGLNAYGLAKLLKPFTIHPHTVRVDGKQAKGYHRDQFLDAWARYCPPEETSADRAAEGTETADFGAPPGGFNPSHRHEPSNDGGFARDGLLFEDSSKNQSVPPESPVNTGGVTVLRIGTPGLGPEDENGAFSTNGRTVADLADEELLAVFPGSTIEFDAMPCTHWCERPSEWRLVPGGLWQCERCHPPVAGLKIERRDLAARS